MLRDGLPPVVDQLLFGQLDNEDRHRLARSFRTVADALAPHAAHDPAPAHTPQSERNQPPELIRACPGTDNTGTARPPDTSGRETSPAPTP